RVLSHWARLRRSEPERDCSRRPPQRWSGFTLELILSNPGAFACIFRHRKRTRRMIENRSWVNILFFLLIWSYYAQLSEQHSVHCKSSTLLSLTCVLFN
ncbi:hypothetical protein PO909_031283, partial [Leuciscus waleckii]